MSAEVIIKSKGICLRFIPLVIFLFHERSAKEGGDHV
jgi:hypothetical protein